MRTRAFGLLVSLSVLTCDLAATAALQQPQDDPVVRRILELGRTDNRVMEWIDVAANRFGGRLTGSDAYTNATRWAVWQFEQWGIDAELDLVGEVPIGFNRGPWFGRMVTPTAKPLYFGTPSFTAGTRGVQRGRTAILKADPFSVPGRGPSAADVEKKRRAVVAAVAEVKADPAAFAGAWVLIGGNSEGFARDGRRNTPEYSDSQLMPPLTKALLDAGALGTVQSSTDPVRILDGYAERWEELPELPDIKLVDRDYDEIRALVEAGTAVELEFEVRNWFKMGPVPYHNVVAVIPGTTHKDEWVVLGGHFDSFDGGTGAVDDGSGFSPGMEAMRLIKLAGGDAPKRSIAMILFAAEENGLVGSQAWLRKRPEIYDDVVVMINRDGAPSAITGAVVPSTWYEPFERITAPLAKLDPRWPFTLSRNEYPSLMPTRPGGTDSVSFAMRGIPTLRFRTQTDYSYRRAWHTLYDVYSELVPYAEHQQHTALATAVVAWGIANLDETLPRDGVFLPDGLFADITFASGARVMTSLDHANAPLQVANLVRIVEGRDGPPSGRSWRRSRGPAIGRIVEAGEGLVRAVIESEVQRAAAVDDLPLRPNPKLKHDDAGVLGLSAGNALYLTRKAQPELDTTCTALGRVIAGASTLPGLKDGDEIRRVRILRSGTAARAFAADDETFGRLLEAADGQNIPPDLEALATRVENAHHPEGPLDPVTSFRATLDVHLTDPNSKEAGQADLEVSYLQRSVPGRKRTEHLIHCKVERAGKPVERGHDRLGYWKLYQGKARDIPESDARDREACQRDKHLARQLVKFLDPGAVLRALQDPTPVGTENLVRGREQPVPCQIVEGTLPGFPLLRLGGGDAAVRAKIYVTKDEGHLLAVLMRPIEDGRAGDSTAEMIRLREHEVKEGMLVPKVIEHFYRDQEQRLVKVSKVHVSKLDLRPEFTLQSLERPKSR